jgi:hypothetical protein
MKTNTQARDFGTVKGAPQAWLRLEGALVFILSILLYGHAGASWWRFLLLLLVPDVAMAGYWLGAHWGAVCYNGAHSYVVPAALLGIAVVSGQMAWIPYLLIWSAHIGMDRALGYGLKYPGSFKQTHLSWLGKRLEA